MPRRKEPAPPLSRSQKARAKVREQAKAAGVTAKELKPRGRRQRRREYSFEELSTMSPSVRARALRGRSAPILSAGSDAAAQAALATETGMRKLVVRLGAAVNAQRR